MFGRKKEKKIDNDKYTLLMDELKRISEGDFSKVDVENSPEPEVAEIINAVIRKFKCSNNNFVMRANEAMQSIGDNSYVKEMLDQVLSQAQSIHNMQESSDNLETSIGDINTSVERIRGNTHSVLNATKESAEGMRENVLIINESSDEINKINEQVQNFQEKINKISEIIDMVKKIASQSNLLALNASIEAARAGEAGKGFAVVADQVRELSSNTSAQADDIVKYVSELQSAIGELAVTMDATTRKLEGGSQKIETSIQNINDVTNQMNDVSTAIDSIYHAVDQQSEVTKEFTEVIKSMTESYDILADDCHKTGEHIYKIGRYVDTLRSDMYRGVSEVTMQDDLKIFEIDHFILTWRVYNNAVEFETLKITQLNNYTGPKACKFGKWVQAQTDTVLTESKEYKNMVEAHMNLHLAATKSWEAKDSGDEELAIKYFKDTLDLFYAFQNTINKVRDFQRKRGITEETEIVVFQK